MDEQVKKGKNMNSFIQKNKDWLNFYSIGARIVGWTFIILSGLPLLLIPYMIYKVPIYTENSTGITISLFGAMLESLLGRLPLGIVLLGVAQLIRYIAESDYKPRWLLRNGTFLLYLFATLTLITPFTRYWYISHFTNDILDFSTIIMKYILPVLTQFLVLIGLGNIFKRIMPVIEEAKSLV